jgi:Arc/MetJ-type ribon-helix-helix transcriptional regulator
MADTEKVTINMSVVDLGQVDLLVEEGFYSSRTDFIRTAIRNLLAVHSEVVKQSVVRKTMAIGAVGYNKAELEKIVADGSQLEIRVVGLFVLDPSISPELARAAIRSLKVLGVFRASNEVKAALVDRILP